jgi:hypothetical protein
MFVFPDMIQFLNVVFGRGMEASGSSPHGGPVV